jgi:hypothetical protein
MEWAVLAHKAMTIGIPPTRQKDSSKLRSEMTICGRSAPWEVSFRLCRGLWRRKVTDQIDDPEQSQDYLSRRFGLEHLKDREHAVLSDEGGLHLGNVGDDAELRDGTEARAHGISL